jgi:hypothetical protein
VRQDLGRGERFLDQTCGCQVIHERLNPALRATGTHGFLAYGGVELFVRPEKFSA